MEKKERREAFKELILRSVKEEEVSRLAVCFTSVTLSREEGSTDTESLQETLLFLEGCIGVGSRRKRKFSSGLNLISISEGEGGTFPLEGERAREKELYI